MQLHDESITDGSINPSQIISDQDKGIRKALGMLRIQCGVPIESFACSKHVERNLFKYTIAKHRKDMQHSFFQLIFESDPKKVPLIQEAMQGFFIERHKKKKVNSTHKLVTNTQNCAGGLQLYNSVTPRFNIMTSNHCEILHAEMYAFRRLDPTNLIIEVLSMQCDKVKTIESMTFDWNTARHMVVYVEEVNDMSNLEETCDLEDTNDPADEEEDPEDVEFAHKLWLILVLNKYYHFLLSE